jgi:hypothetical protein
MANVDSPLPKNRNENALLNLKRCQNTPNFEMWIKNLWNQKRNISGSTLYQSSLF